MSHTNPIFERSLRAIFRLRPALTTLWLAVCFTAASFAVEPGGLKNFDRRTADLAGKRTPVSAAATLADGQLRARVEGVRIDRDALLGAPKFISAARGFLSGPAGEGGALPAAATKALPAGDANRPVRAFLNEYQALFGFRADALDRAKVIREDVTPHSGLRTVVWQQQLDGILVFEAILKAGLSKKGELINIGSGFVANPAAAAAASAAILATPPIGAEAAVVAAAQNIGVTLAAGETTALDAPQDAERRQRFQAPAQLNGAEARLVWLPMDAATLRLCWKVVLVGRASGRMFTVLVDARDGEVLVRRNLTADIQNAQYNVFTGESPTPSNPDLVMPATTQPAAASRQVVTFGALNETASPDGWIPDGGNRTIGNNVHAHLDTDNDNVADANSAPLGSPFRVFNFALDLTQAPASNQSASTVQLFYWCNFAHDQLYDLGFTESAGNFQIDNFGRGGNGGDPVQADNQDASVSNTIGAGQTPPVGVRYNNANFSTPPDDGGITFAPRMQMYLFNGPTPDRDGSLDAEIVLHEYIHGLSNRLVGAGVGISALQTDGMGEGWSDFYALALLSKETDDVHANYAAGAYATRQFLGRANYANYYYGIRRYPYCTSLTVNPLTFADIDPAQLSLPANTVVPINPAFDDADADEVHAMGEVWCAMLWEARANLIDKLGFAAGNQLILQLVTDGMKNAPVDPNFIQARDAIYQAEMAFTGGMHRAALENAFAKRGLGLDATSPDSNTTAGVVESFREANPPEVTITNPTHNSVIQAFSGISGTATDHGGSGIAGDVVSFVLYHIGTSEYWSGSGWSPTMTQIFVNANASGVWSYSGGLPSGALQRRGQYSLTASTLDNAGNPSTPESEVNNIFFRVDDDPPAVGFTAPLAGTTIGSLPEVSGFASDDSGVASVSLFIRRLSDNAFWNGSQWIPFTGTYPTLTTFYDENDDTWRRSSGLPQPGSDPNVHLRDGQYELIAIAQDKGGNVRQRGIIVTVEVVFVWTGATLRDADPFNSDRWDTAANWDLGSVPGAGDIVVIDNGDAVQSTVARTVRGLRLGGDATQLGEYNVTITGGPGASVWSDGTINGALIVAAGAHLTIDTSYGPYLLEATLVNNGTVVMTGNPDINGGGALYGHNSTFTNNGRTEIARDGVIFQNLGIPPLIDNLGGGAFVKTAGAGVSTVDWVVDNNNLVAANVGTLSLVHGSTAAGSVGAFHTVIPSARIQFAAGGHVLKAGARFTGPGRGRITAATVYLDGAVTVGVAGTPAGGFEIVAEDGVLNGPGSLSVLGGGGTFLWSDGTISTTVTVGAGASFLLDTTDGPYLNTGIFNHAGSGIVTGDPAINGGGALYGHDSTFNNTGTLAIARQGVIFQNVGIPPTINNSGTLRKTVAGGTSTVDWALNNAGLLESQSGTIALVHGSTVTGSTGIFQSSAADARILFAAGGHVLKAGARFTGLGRGRITAATVTLNGAITAGVAGTPAGGFEMVGEDGVLNGAGSLSVGDGGTFLWHDGTISTTVSVSAGASFLLDTTYGPYLNTGTFHHAGTGIITGDPAINGGGALLGHDSTFNNTGTLDIARQGVIFQNVGIPPTINNSGTLRKTIAGGTSTVDWALNNAGLLESQSGTLSLVHGSTAAGSPGVFQTSAADARIQFAAGGHVLKAGARFTGLGRGRITASTVYLEGAVTVGVAGTPAGGFEMVAEDGVLNGPGSLSVLGGAGTFLWSDGTISTTVTVAAGASFLLDTTYGPYLNTGTFHHAGNGVVTGDPVINGGGALYGHDSTFNNTGTLDIARQGVIFQNSGIPPTINNTGTLRKTFAGGTSTVDWALNNPGFVEVQSGTLSLVHGSTATGSTGIFQSSAAAARIQFAAGGHVLKSGARFTGPGRGQITAASVFLEGTVTAGTAASPAGGFEMVGDSGVLNGPGSLSVAGAASTFGWSDGTISTALSIAAGSRLELDTTDNPYLNSGSVTNAGTAIVTGNPGTVLYGHDATFTNTGTLQIARNGTLFQNVGITPTFLNLGTIVRTAGAGANDFGSFALSNLGVLSLPAGATLRLTNAVTLGAGTQIAGGGKVLLETGGATINGAIAVVAGTLEMIGDGSLLIGAVDGGGNPLGTINGPDTFLWKDGTITGKLNLGATAIFHIDTTAGPYLYAATLNNAGAARIDGAGEPLHGHDSTFNNLANSQLTIARGGNVLANLGLAPTLVNAGAVVIGSSLASVESAWNFTQTATGRLEFELGGTNAVTPLFDQFKITGTATLGGKLKVGLVNGFQPALANSFTVMTFGAHVGDFATREGLGLGNGLLLNPVLTETALTLNTVQSAFHDWQIEKFGANANNPLIAGPLANPDRDQANNALEYAFNLNPLLPDGASAMPIVFALTDTGTGLKHLAITYRRRITASDLTYTVRVANEAGGAWDDTGTQLQPVGAPIPTGDTLTERITFRLIAPMQGVNRKFLQLSVRLD